jgi:hypothetical protein
MGRQINYYMSHETEDVIELTRTGINYESKNNSSRKIMGDKL